MKFTLRIALAMAGTALMPLASAMAADYDPPIYVDQAPEYQPVEVGSGWYLRGDVAYLPQRSYGDLDFSAPASASMRNRYVFASLGAGYHFTDYLRGDINIGLLPGNRFNADTGTGTRISAKNRGVTAMVNGYVDLGTYVGITPYVGAGIGMFQSKRVYDISGDTSGSKTQVSLAYSLNAGVAYQLTKNVQFDLGYQYLSAPDAEYASIDNSAYSVRKGVDDHQIKVGLRYDLW